MKTVAKALIAFLGGLGTWGATSFADGKLDAVEAFGLCAVLATALAVYAVPNEPDDAGGVDLGTVLLVVLVVAVLLLLTGHMHVN